MSQSATPHKGINEMLVYLSEEIQAIFGKDLTGIYLTGSLSYDAFDSGRSNVDLAVILQCPANHTQIELIRSLHHGAQSRFPKWAKRLDCYYTPKDMLTSTLPPGNRPWYWGVTDILYPEATYGNEWIINNYLLYEHAIPLIGPDFNELMEPVDIREVQKACILDLFVEWEPKKNDTGWFESSHYESFFILNLCRILYTVECADAVSKQMAASWVMDHYSEPWPSLVSTALQWEHGMNLNLKDEALNFLDFAIPKVLSTELGREMSCEIAALRQGK